MYSTKFPLNSRIIDFPDPFMSFSNIIYPSTVQEVFYWADRLWLRNGIYSQAIKKCVRYFLNDIDLTGDDLSHDTRKKYQTFLMEQMNILDQLGQVGDDVIAYGNSFTSVSVPLRRSLVCPNKDCGLSRPLETLKLDEDYKWKDYSFVGDCPQCKMKAQTFRRIDASGVSKHSKIKIIRWAPQYVSIKHCSITGESDYYYEIPAEEKRRIKDGDPVFIRSMPWELIESVKNDRPFKFNKETFYHLKCNTAANLVPMLKGWGLPLFMSNFSQVVHLQILERFNEAIAMDYIVPFRVLTPPTTGGASKTDPMLSNNMGNFMGAVRRMVKQHRQDPTSWHTLPFPLEYQAIGGEAKSLVPVELIDRAQDVLLTSMGVPQEFYRGSITMGGSGPPISLRMFEKTWTHYTTMLDDWLGWFLVQCGRIMGWEGNITGKLERTSIVEDEMGKQVKLNLASAKVISNRTALKAFGIDMDREREQIIEEDRIMNELMREEQKKDEQTMMLTEQMATIPPDAAAQNMGMPPGAEGGAPPAGGPVGAAPMPPAGAAPMGGGTPSMDDMMAQAEQTAQQIMSMDPTTRRNELTNLKKSNPTLHAQVKQMISDMEQGVKSNALAQAKQQASQGGGAM